MNRWSAAPVALRGQKCDPPPSVRECTWLMLLIEVAVHFTEFRDRFKLFTALGMFLEY